MKKIACVVLVFSLISIAVALAMGKGQNVDPQTKAMYREVLAEQLMTEWKCIPVNDKKAQSDFILSLMDRYAPGDREFMQDGRKQAKELERKSASMTVEDRNKIKSAYYFQRPNFQPSLCWDDKPKQPSSMANWNGLTPNIASKACTPDYLNLSLSQSDPYRLDLSGKVDDFGIVYADRYVRWMFGGDRWRDAVDRELEQGKIVIDDPKEYRLKQYKLEQQARDQAKAQIAAMSALDVPEGKEEAMTEALYKKLYSKLACDEIKAAKTKN